MLCAHCGQFVAALSRSQAKGGSDRQDRGMGHANDPSQLAENRKQMQLRQIMSL